MKYPHLGAAQVWSFLPGVCVLRGGVVMFNCLWMVEESNNRSAQSGKSSDPEKTEVYDSIV